MSDYSAHNAEVVRVAIRQYRQEVERLLERALREVAAEMVAQINRGFSSNQDHYPVYTANLHDATGIGIYVNGAISAFMPTKWAQKEQTSGFGGYWKGWGIEELRRAIADSGDFSRGIWIVLYSSVPYAAYIEAAGSDAMPPRGAGFFSSLKDMLRYEIFAKLRPISA